MKKIFVNCFPALLACFFWIKNAEAQSRRAVVELQPHQLNQAILKLPDGQQIRKISALADVPLQPTGPFLAYSIVWYSNSWEEKNDHFTVLFGTGGPSEVVTIHPDSHADPSPRRHVSELYFLEKNAAEFRLHFTGTARIDSIAVHFFDPGLSRQSAVGSGQSAHPSSLIPHPSIRSTCTCPQPAYQGRLDWCPDGTCPTDPTPEFVPVATHIIVHHTAGTNTASDWAAVVRSIWDFHVNTNGWDDIGYNWLVDPNGVLYEGRGDGRLGAHFCGQNGQTVGICVMGDFTGIQPTNDAVNTLEDFLAWKCCDENLDPLGSAFHASSGLTLMRISGHRDGCTTSCPGDSFYPTLPDVRLAVQDKITTGCDADVVAAPTVLAVTYVGYAEVGLSWLDNAVGETGYVLERSDLVNMDFVEIAQLPPNSTAFADQTVLPGLTYFYRVKAVQGAASSAYSNEAIVVTSTTATESALLNGETVRISPNPTGGLASVMIDNQWVGMMSASVFDGTGRQVQLPVFYEKQVGQVNFELDLSGLPAGVFWIKMVQGDEVGWFRVLKN
ncbi:MAG: N-acetylmuramoyl-L-alanine amidase [Bacteroidetes bacterium]|nr:N-acetylmuramoyl-L-alanine amidase [Bacteroidota bacterium]